MGVELQLTPPNCSIPATGGTSKHMILNLTDKQLAFKVISSSNSNYSVNIKFGVIESCKAELLRVTRKIGKPKADKIVIQYASIEEGSDPLTAFASGNPVGEITGETALKLSAAK